MLGNRKLEVDDYWEILKRRKWIILLPTALVTALAVGIAHIVPPTYESQTLVLIEGQKVPDDYVKSVIAGDLDGRLASMKEQILSRSRIQPITERYNLFAGKGMTMDDRIEKVRRQISIKPIHSEIEQAGGLPGFFIAFSAPDPHTAQLVCGEITSLFVGENLRSREASAQGTTDFLKGQLADAKRSLDEQDAKLAAFQRQYGGKLPNEQDSNLNMLTSINTQLQAANESLSRMEQDKSYLESVLALQVHAASSHASGITPGATPADETELQALLSLQADLSTRYTADYPDVIVLKKKIADLRAKIAQHPASTKGTAPAVIADAEPLAVQDLRAQLRAAQNGIQSKRKEQEELQNAVRQYQERIASSPLVAAQYKDLTRDYETAQKFYDDLLAKMNQSKMATDLERRQQGEQFRVMDEPNLPDAPKSPNQTMYLLGGFAFGLALGAAIAALLEYKDTAIRTERDVSALTRLPTIAIISLSGIDEGDESSKHLRGSRRSFNGTKGMRVTEVH